MSPISDAGERQKALDPTCSFIVQAPAGSGKTELLIQRLLKLLALVEQPEQILAMTFTRKAAGEMKTRVLDALEKAQSNTGQEIGHKAFTWNLARQVLEQDRKKGWRLLENPSRLKVQTIDSLCTTLTRQMPLLSGLGAPLVIEENADELYRETARRILRQAESEGSIGNSVRVILKHLDNSKSTFQKRITQMLGKRDQWMIPFFEKIKITENSRPYLENVLSSLIESILKETIELFPAMVATGLPRFAAYSGADLAEKDRDHPGACLKDLTALPKPAIAFLSQWKALANLLLTQDGNWRKSVDTRIGFPAGKNKEEKVVKTDFINLLATLSDFPGLEKALNSVRQLPNPRFTENEWEVLEATLTLLPEMDHALRGIFRERGKTDFTELSLSALKALGDADNPTDLLLYLDTRIQHILVDEYQDTSYKQRELLKRLTAGWLHDDGRTLFIVGDPMQSIYRFRDAEVGLFLHTRDSGIGDIRLEPLTLKANFRSQKKIVDWVNLCFSAIFPKKDDPDLGSIQYSPSDASLSEENWPGVVLHPVLDPEGIDEAGQIVDLIQTTWQEHPRSSIAILVRARSHLREIVRNFHEQGIPFKAEEIDPLTTRPYILDLLALLRALISPLDRVSWLSILRAPWCGLSLADLHKLCHNDADSPVWFLLNDSSRVAQLSPDGQQRLRRIVPIMAETLKVRHTDNLRDILEGCWTALGGPACLESSTLKDVELFFEKVAALLDEEDMETLHCFDRVLDALYAGPTAEIKDAVQIMTMHKAKGLEFDFVLLPGLGKREKSEQKRLVYWMPHGDDLLLAPIQETGGEESETYRFLSRFDMEKEQFETLRLLYVSSTRAKKQLHLFGHASVKNEEVQPAPNSLLGKLWPYLGDDWRKAQKADQPKYEASSGIYKSRIHRLPADFMLPPANPSIKPGTAVELSEAEKPEFEWAGSQARCLGIVLHQCFKAMAEQGLERWAPDRIDKMIPYLESAMHGEGLFQTRGTIHHAMKALKNILQDPTGRWVLSSHKEHRSEYPLTGVLNDNYIERTIDRTFVDEHNVRWIIDYKTGEHEGTDLEGFFHKEIERYRPQMEQYEELIRLGGETRPIKKALYYPMHRRLVEITM